MFAAAAVVIATWRIRMDGYTSKDQKVFASPLKWNYILPASDREVVGSLSMDLVILFHGFSVTILSLLWFKKGSC